METNELVKVATFRYVENAYCLRVPFLYPVSLFLQLYAHF